MFAQTLFQWGALWMVFRHRGSLAGSRTILSSPGRQIGPARDALAAERRQGAVKIFRGFVLDRAEMEAGFILMANGGTMSDVEHPAQPGEHQHHKPK
jgi:hypothetical protein